MNRPKCQEKYCTNITPKYWVVTGEQKYRKRCNTHMMAARKAFIKTIPITSEVTPHSGTRPHNIWCLMRRRCDNPNDPVYKYYGGRGITYQTSWKSFANFWEDMGSSYSKELSIERVDNNKGYSVKNCTWATKVEQTNNKRDNHKLSYNGRTLGINQWAREVGIKRQTISYRIKYGWSIEAALTKGVN